VPSKDPVQRFEDILGNIVRIEEFTAGMELATFVQGPKTSNAAERCLERISEAAKKLGAVAEELCPGIPRPGVRAVGNLLRYESGGLDRGSEGDVPAGSAARTYPPRRLCPKPDTSIPPSNTISLQFPR